MPTKTERSKVQVKESSTPDLRTFEITLTVPVSDFQLTDLLKQRGVIDGVEVQLKQSVKQALEEYLNSAETLIAGLSTNSPSSRKGRANGTRSVGSSQENLETPLTVEKA
jgi:hypothetical protein